MNAVRPEKRSLLPLTPIGRAGFRHGSRSYLTCKFRCGNACDHPEPNRSGNGHIRDELVKVVDRRTVLQGAAAGAGALALGGGLAVTAVAPAAAAGPLATAGFRPVAPNRRDAVTVPDGFDWNVVIRWGDPVVPGAPGFDVHRRTVDAVKKQFGYNNDHVGVVPLGSTRALMVVNHEYDDPTLMYPTGAYDAQQMAEFGIYEHGLSVVTIRRGKTPGSWFRVTRLTDAPHNRRINADTTFKVRGPAAGHALLKTGQDATGSLVKGTLNNCSGGITPWGTILSGEENFNQYFEGTVPADPPNAAGAYQRYGITGGAGRGWAAVQPRFDLGTEPNEPHRFGWIVEIDPTNPTSTPVKHSMLGRFKHEGANVVIAKNGKAVAYMGDDERGDYLYKFVSAGTYDPQNRKANLQLLTKGTLYVAKLNGDGTADGKHDGTGKWYRLCTDTESFVDGMSVAEVLIFTRLAADKLSYRPTRMDRPEDVEPNKVNGRVYAALTNNSNRGGAFPVDEANPIGSSQVRASPAAPLTDASGNRNGYVLEMIPDSGNHASSVFTWNLMLICGDPEAPETYFAGYDKSMVSPISCPDNVTFDTAGNLWISTDGNALGGNDGLFRVPTSGVDRGKVQQFLTVPKGAECCGPLIYDGDRSLFFAPQHPGELDGATFESPASTWPHSNDFPRPAVCVAYRQG